MNGGEESRSALCFCFTPLETRRYIHKSVVLGSLMKRKSSAFVYGRFEAKKPKHYMKSSKNNGSPQSE